jgi:hypothetical protein
MATYTVAGGGDILANGDYAESGTANGKPQYIEPINGGYLIWNGLQWEIQDNVGAVLYYTATAGATPPSTGWTTNAPFGTAPAPTVTLASSAPVITSFTPTAGTVNTEVVITGTGFTGCTDVSFYYAGLLSGAAYDAWTFVVDSDTQITATVTALPVGENAPNYFGEIRVTTPGGTDQTTPPPYFQFSPQTTTDALGFFAFMG